MPGRALRAQRLNWRVVLRPLHKSFLLSLCTCVSGEKLQHLPRCRLGACSIGTRARALRPQPGSVHRWVLATAISNLREDCHCRFCVCLKSRDRRV
uniref:Uncharacterized protein n=1 Tax=Mus musculus TaxID=10090 RepID=Q3TYV4_MOUSE|nr:unnamed protein product [Mus musculus]